MIDSIKDERIAAARALTTGPGRRAAGRCLVEGAALVGQVVAAGIRPAYVLCAAGAEDLELWTALADAGVPVHPVRDGLLHKVARQTDWLAVVDLPGEVPPDEPYGDFAVVCERVVDQGNVGTIVRTARALGVRDVVLTDATDLYARRVLDASRGAVLDSRVRRFADPAAAVAAMRAAGFQIVVASPRGAHPQSVAPLTGARVALVVGNETDGVDPATQAAADLVVRIPMAGPVESLNVGVATGISIYELRMRMILTMLTDRIRDTLGRNLTVAGQLSRRAFDAELARAGELDSRQAVLLMILACERATPAEQLRRDIGVDADELAEVLDPLRGNGYVVGQDSDVAITELGERAVAALWAVQERVEDELYRGVTAAEREQLADLLRRVQHNAARLLPPD